LTINYFFTYRIGQIYLIYYSLELENLTFLIKLIMIIIYLCKRLKKITESIKEINSYLKLILSINIIIKAIMSMWWNFFSILFEYFLISNIILHIFEIFMIEIYWKNRIYILLILVIHFLQIVTLAVNYLNDIVIVFMKI